MSVGLFRDDSSSGGAVDEADLQQIRFIDIFQSDGLFTDRTGDGLDTDRSAFEPFDDAPQIADIHIVQSQGIHFQLLQGFLGDVQIDDTVVSDLSEIADSAEETVGDTRCSAGTLCDLMDRIIIDPAGKDF